MHPEIRRGVGFFFTLAAWILLLWGFANLVMAKLYNNQEELGLGIDSTMLGARWCLLSALVAGIGIPVWVKAERELRLQKERR